MASSRKSQPTPAGESRSPEAEPPGPDGSSGTPAGEEGVTAEQLAELVRRMENGFYDRAEVRDRIARRLLGDLDP